MSKNTRCKDAIKEWLKREKAKAERLKREWEEKQKAENLSDEERPENADGQMHNPDGTVFTNAKDAKKVSLICMIPPIAKMEQKSLNDLARCEHLALSTNCITNLINLGNLRELKILSLSRNCIKQIKYLDPLAGSLEQLWMSYNQVDKLDGLSKLRKLKIFYIANNKISDINEFAKLKDCPALEQMVALGNPVYDGDAQAARASIIRLVPSLKVLDGKRIELEEREAAEAVGAGE